jgi:peptide-methionine (R)-S-oxide reductase
MNEEFSEEELRKKLDEKTFQVMREKDTEPAFSSNLLNNKEDGEYFCKVCGSELFSSKEKLDSGTGWPSFLRAKNEKLELKEDNSFGMKRTEVICKKCKSHLGHVFDEPTRAESGIVLMGCA